MSLTGINQRSGSPANLPPQSLNPPISPRMTPRNSVRVLGHGARPGHRPLLPRHATPTLILRAPCAVGEYMQDEIPASALHVIDTIGHRAHPGSPDARSAAMLAVLAFLAPSNLPGNA